MHYKSTFEVFAKSFKIKPEALYLACANPTYTRLHIPKSNGELREVFAPEANLKLIQRKVADRLNKFYAKITPPGVMGFVRSKPWKNEKRDIVANAMKHRKSHYLLNLDIKSFFPSINTNMVIDAISRLVKIDVETQRILNTLLMHNGSLPPGSPASPVISNIVFLPLDIRIQKYCDKHKITYTRYVDDITLSSKKKIDNKHIEYICREIVEGGFEINKEKTKSFAKDETKEVTGVAIVKKKLKLCQDTIDDINSNIKYYHDWKQRILKQYGATDLVNQKIKSMQRSIKGQLNFAKRIDTAEGKTYKNMVKDYEQSLDEKTFTTKFYI